MAVEAGGSGEVYRLSGCDEAQEAALRALFDRVTSRSVATTGPTLGAPRQDTAGPTMADPDRQEELARFGFTVVDLFDAPTLDALRALSREVQALAVEVEQKIDLLQNSRGKAA